MVLLVVAAWGGTLERIHHALYVLCREQAGCEASPTAAIIDSQSVEGLAGLVRDLTAIAPDVLRTAA